MKPKRPKKPPALSEALAKVPQDWTDLKEVQKLLPPGRTLEELEKAKLIEVRQANNPQRMQVRRIQKPPDKAA